MTARCCRAVFWWVVRYPAGWSDSRTGDGAGGIAAHPPAYDYNEDGGKDVNECDKIIVGAAGDVQRATGDHVDHDDYRRSDSEDDEQHNERQAKCPHNFQESLHLLGNSRIAIFYAVFLPLSRPLK